MNSWYFIACTLIAACGTAYAVDHDVLREPLAAARTVSSANRSERLSPQQLVDRRPELFEGSRWLCSVGQSKDVDRRVREQALMKGWGFWSFAAHKKCPPGVYACLVKEGRLRATGDPIWNGIAESAQVSQTCLRTYAPLGESGSSYGYGSSASACVASSVAGRGCFGATSDYVVGASSCASGNGDFAFHANPKYLPR